MTHEEDQILNILHVITAEQHKQGMRLRRVENVLIGDREFQIDGVVDQVKFHHKKINEFTNDKNKIIGASLGLGGIVGFLASWLQKHMP